MKSLFSRFKPAAPGTGPPPGKSRPRPSFDEKKPVPDDDDSTVRVKRKPSLRPRSGLASVTGVTKAALRSPTPSSTASAQSNTKHSGGGSSTAARAATRHARSASVASRASSHAHSDTKPAPAVPSKDEPQHHSHSLPSIPDIPLASDGMGEWGAVATVGGAADRASARSPRHRVSFDNVKKVAFQSPSRGTDTPPPTASETDLRRATLPARVPSRRQSGSPTRHLLNRTASTNSRPESPSKQLSRSSSTTSHQVRKSALSNVDESPTKSTKSSLLADNSEDNDAMSEKSYLPQPESWSAIMDEELIANLGPRERARQEVLWEIINSEEKPFVAERDILQDTSSSPRRPQPGTSRPTSADAHIITLDIIRLARTPPDLLLSPATFPGQRIPTLPPDCGSVLV
ncbi:hypothetical protein A1Q1_02580 [Trichosporon asahii var. asahii CBS 2479]|uniref:Uncharacterized protein n=1 Tax=Trichosporon asahii var. asahii (strain ATCC 90039 / CBS 2479 / JCM 2466 / KCTC 7840 / NBRC 103889/ NCYC 2677 / UAMH 7654) TaxID=1186058 RepID=J5QPN4_TRIAS|nr:hypothetical protein A1Q1_02580 [Trichosporon asahii var. asahii CBS 2479]EJT48448.1 hypothetical protein A1Q1_02580 [Trichosporon asahii var. asahii CBS 2479]